MVSYLNKNNKKNNRIKPLDIFKTYQETQFLLNIFLIVTYRKL